jgi:hypothetical protein
MAKARVQEAITRVRPQIGEPFTPEVEARPYPFYLTSGASED